MPRKPPHDKRLSDPDGPLNTRPAQSFFDDAPLPMWVFDEASFMFCAANRAACQLFGYTREEFQAMSIMALHTPDDVERVHGNMAMHKLVGNDAEGINPSWQLLTKQGQSVWVDVHTRSTVVNGRSAVVVIAMDARTKLEDNNRLAIHEAYFHQLFEYAADAIVLLDRSHVIVDANSRFLSLFGYDMADVAGRRADQLLVPDDFTDDDQPLPERTTALQADSPDTQRRRKDGSLRDVDVQANAITMAGQQVGTYLKYFDLSETKKLRRQLAYYTTHDSVTGLMNRHELQRILSQLIMSSRGNDVHHVLMFISLHQSDLLAYSPDYDDRNRILADLRQRFRRTLGTYLVAQLHADEYVVLMPDVAPDDVPDLAERMITDINASSSAMGYGKTLKTNIGALCFDSHAPSTDMVLKMARIASRIAEEKGGSPVYIARRDDPELARYANQLDMVGAINDAMSNDGLVLYAQKIVAVHHPSGRDNLEILVRMRGANGDIIPPGHFLPIAERHDMMFELDCCILDKLFGTLDKVLTARQRIRPIINVNLSGESLGHEGLLAFVNGLFDKHRVRPEQICFEATETAAIENMDQARHFISRMRDRGAMFALDDFGSGMSSFRYLRELNVDYLKVDGLFIKNILSSDTDSIMTEAICRMAHTLGIATVAEWIEDQATLDYLSTLHIDYVQGFMVHKPEPLTPELLVN